MKILYINSIAVFVLMSMVTCRQEDAPCNQPLYFMKVVEYGSTEPVQGAEVILFNGSYPVKTVITDETGIVSWDCNLGISDVCASGENYWDYCGFGYSLNMSFVADYVYELSPKAWVKLNVVDEEPINPETNIFHSDGVEGQSFVQINQDSPHLIKWCGNRRDTLTITEHEMYNGQQINLALTKIPITVHPQDTISYTYYY